MMARRYYDPATKPYPRALPAGGQELSAHSAKDSRQQRRARERELKKQQPHTQAQRAQPDEDA